MEKLISKIVNILEEKKLDYSFLKYPETNQYIKKIAATFSLNLNNKYLWENSRYINYTAKYLDGFEQWNKELSHNLKLFKKDIFIVISDEEFNPWPILKIKNDKLISILSELQYFEYFLFDEELKCLLFDTHENEILLLKVS